jgi:hypothetical protein
MIRSGHLKQNLKKAVLKCSEANHCLDGKGDYSQIGDKKLSIFNYP